MGGKTQEVTSPHFPSPVTENTSRCWCHDGGGAAEEVQAPGLSAGGELNPL